MNQKGYTLIELLLYVAMIGILLLGASSFFSLSLSARIKSQSITEVNQQGVAAMEYITQTIRNATSITSPAAGATSNSLTLVVPNGSLSPTIFNLAGSTLQVKEGAAAAIALTNSTIGVGSLTFKNLSRSGTDGIIQISFVVSRTNAGGRPEYNYQQTFTSSVSLR